MRQALVYNRLSSNRVRCLVCQRRCLISESQTGFCLTKINLKGQLFTLNYKQLNGPVQVDPIEKKPFYHFLPGDLVPSIGSWGCNFRCRQCLNHWCSWGEPASSTLSNLASPASGRNKLTSPHNLSPTSLINRIKSSGYRTIAFTYNEPVVWAEYVFTLAKIAKKNGLFTLFVSNGSWSKETLDKVGPYLDAANIDLKGFSDKSYRKQGAFFGKIPDMLVYAQKKHRIFLELTTLLIPGVNDSQDELDKMTAWIAENLGRETPWHLSRFDPKLAPDPEFRKISPTSVSKLKTAADIGRRNGLYFVYIWAPGQDLPGGLYAESDTICHKCKKVVVKRSGWQPDLTGVNRSGHCRFCGQDVNIRMDPNFLS